MMIPRHFLPCLALLAGPVPAADPIGDLIFSNGDQLGGLSGVGYEDGHIVLQGEDVIPAVSKLPLNRLFQLRLHGGPPPVANAGHLARLQLNNGDMIEGKLRKLGPDRVSLDTWFVDDLSFNRSMCGSLEIQRSEPAVYVGPDPLENWAGNDDEAWSLRNQELVSNGRGHIAREIKLPERSRLGFTIAWRNALKFRLLLFGSEGDAATPSNCYDVGIQRRFAYVRKRWKTPQAGGTQTVGRPVMIRELDHKNQVDMELFIDRKGGSIALYIDGRRSQIWTDADPGTGEFGNWFHLVSEDTPIRISKFAAYPWHGSLPANPNSRKGVPGPGGPDGDPRFQQEGLVINGIAATDDGDMVIKMPDGPVPLPEDRSVSIDLLSPDSEEPIRKKHDVRAWLRDGGHITFELRAIDREFITGHSQTFGERRFKLDAFSHIEFNIYTEDLDSRRATLKWEEDD